MFGCLSEKENPHQMTSRFIVQLLSGRASWGMIWKLEGSSRWKLDTVNTPILHLPKSQISL